MTFLLTECSNVFQVLRKTFIRMKDLICLSETKNHGFSAEISQNNESLFNINKLT